MNTENESKGKVIPIDANRENINPNKEPLTAEKLKQLCSKELDDATAERVLYGIHSLCNIIYEFLIQDSVNDGNETVNNDNNQQQKQAA